MINHLTTKHQAYVDVRGPWPTLVHGQAAVTLQGCYNRRITVEEAIEFVLGIPPLILSSDRDAAFATDLDIPFTTE